MHIAVVMPAFDVAPFVGDAVESVLGQSHTDWSLVVVDDGSTDATSMVASGFSDARIRVIRQQNAGVSAARNRGIVILAADPRPPDAFLFLDADDWLAPDALAVLAAALDDSPWAVAAFGRYARVAMDGSMRIASRTPDGCLLERLLIGNRFANGGHLLIRRDAIQSAGLFRTELSFGEDWEYWTRVALVGEFAAPRSRAPLLFVRERAAGASLTRASDPAAYWPAVEAIFANPVIARRLGPSRLALLRDRTMAETDWTVGRELVRHGRFHEGLSRLARSLWRAPSLRRIVLLGLSCSRFGPFRPYRLPTG